MKGTINCIHVFKYSFFFFGNKSQIMNKHKEFLLLRIYSPRWILAFSISFFSIFFPISKSLSKPSNYLFFGPSITLFSFWFLIYLFLALCFLQFMSISEPVVHYLYLFYSCLVYCTTFLFLHSSRSLTGPNIVLNIIYNITRK